MWYNLDNIREHLDDIYIIKLIERRNGTMVENFNMTKAEMEALKNMIEGYITDWDYELNNIPGNYLAEKLREGIYEVGYCFGLYYDYFQEMQDSWKCHNKEKAERAWRYLLDQGFFERFTPWRERACEQCYTELNKR